MTRKSFLKKCSKNFVPFFEWVEDYCRQHGKKITIVNSSKINFFGGACSGWCDGNEIALAARGPLFEETFVHEFSHLTQAVEEIELWKEDFSFWTDLQKGRIAADSYFSVLEIIALERDCEARSLAFSKKWNLFDNKIYAQRANTYLYYYQYVFLSRFWSNSAGIYCNPELISSMPEKLLPMKEFLKIDMERMMAFELSLGKGSKLKKILPKPATLSKIRA
jgi:hypothetical protein